MPLSNDPNLFETIVSNLSNGIYIIQDDCAVYLNKRFGEIFGYESVEPLLSCNMYDQVYPDRLTVDLFRSVHDQMLASGQTKAAWGQSAAQCDGTPIWVEVEAQLVTLDNRPAIMGMFHDRTDCKLIGEAMHVSQETLRLLLDAMEDRVYVVTDELKIVYANKKMKATLCGDINTELCYKVCRGLEAKCADCAVEQVFNSDKPMYKEFYNDLTHKWYSVIELAIRMPGINRPTKLAVARDITARKEDEQKIRALSHRLISALEDERKFLSRELHDDLGQQLNAIKMSIDTLAEDISDSTPEIEKRFNYVSGLVQDSIQAIRYLSTGLRPYDLEQRGLVNAIKDHCEKVSELHGLNIHFSAAGMSKLKLSSGIEINLFRVFQEAIHNIIKHAEARSVNVRLTVSHPNIRMIIDDDGKGFELPKNSLPHAETSRLGLVGMAERIDLLNGNLQVMPKLGKGTRIIAEIPIYCEHTTIC